MWRVQWPSDVQSALRTDKNPTGDLTINDCPLTRTSTIGMKTLIIFFIKSLKEIDLINRPKQFFYLLMRQNDFKGFEEHVFD